MAMKGSGGGGYGSKQHVDHSIRTGAGSRSARPAGVSQIGSAVGNHSSDSRHTSNYTGEKLHNDRSFQPVPYGNQVALNSGQRPGQGRDIHAAGSQGQHGSVAGTRAPQGRGILDNS